MPSGMAPRAPTALTLNVLRERQAEALGWTSRARLTTPREAEQFLKRYGLVLRYAASRTVPLASLRSASGPANQAAALEASIHLTNHLLDSATGIEVNVVGHRLVIVHRTLMPALHRLVRRGRPPTDHDGLSLAAQTAYALIVERREVSAGDVRRRLGTPATARHDPGYDALAELQRHLLVDRGPFAVPTRGIPYLSREGYPYHLFDQAHADLARASRDLDRDDAMDRLIAAYVRGASFAAPRTLASLFGAFLTTAEIAASVERLTSAAHLARIPLGRRWVVGVVTG
jgi:hypothetical protein